MTTSMDTETVGIIGFFALLFAVGLVLRLVLHFARKPFEGLMDRLIPGEDLAVKVSRQMRIAVDTDKNAWDPERFSVDLGPRNPAEDMVVKASENVISDPVRARYHHEWRDIQRLFAEAPEEAVRAADRLLRDFVIETGIEVPLKSHKTTNSDIGVDIEMVKDVYRHERNARAGARGIELSRKHEHASAEDLTQAMDHYRALFDELLLPR